MIFFCNKGLCNLINVTGFLDQNWYYDNTMMHFAKTFIIILFILENVFPLFTKNNTFDQKIHI